MTAVVCITIKPPYSELIAMGVKTGEFRNWTTSYRGELYIHAAARADTAAIGKFMAEYPNARVRFGEIICVVNLKNIVESNEFEGYRYKWEIELKKVLKPGIHMKGKLGLWKTQI